MEGFNHLRTPEELKSFPDLPRNSPSAQLTSPVPFETISSELYQYLPSTNHNQSVAMTPELYWPYGTDPGRPYGTDPGRPYGTDPGRASYNNSYGATGGQYSYWRSSPYPNADVMMCRDWSSPSPENYSYCAPSWPIEAIPSCQGGTVNTLTHILSQWPTGVAVTSCDQPVPADSAGSEANVPDAVADYAKTESTSCGQSSFTNLEVSPWKPIAPMPPTPEILGQLSYSPCMWLSEPPMTSPENVKLRPLEVLPLPPMPKEVPVKKVPAKTFPEIQKDPLKENVKGVRIVSTQTRWKLKPEKRQVGGHNIKQVEPTNNSRKLAVKKPELYKRQKILQKERENAIREALNRLNSLLPLDSQNRKLSKNMVLHTAIEYICRMQKSFGDSWDGPPKKGPRKEPLRTPTMTSQRNGRNINQGVRSINGGLKYGAVKKRPSSSKKLVYTTPERPSYSLLAPSPLCSDSPPTQELRNSPLTSPQSSSGSPSGGSQSSTDSSWAQDLADTPPKRPRKGCFPIQYCRPDLQTLMKVFKEPDLLTPSESSSGSDSSTGLGSTTSEDKHIKRPMNAFLLFSKSNRENFKAKFPGRDNRKISTMLGECWNCMGADEKRPFQDMARELMRKTKAAYPDFKYSPAEQSGKLKVAREERVKTPKKAFSVGCHILRDRQGGKQGFVRISKEDRNFALGALEKIEAEDNQPHRKRKPDSTTPGFEAEEPSPKRRKQKTPRKADLGVCQGDAKRNEAPSLGDRPKATNGFTELVPRACDNWVQCDKCKQWRLLRECVDPTALPEKWYCWLNEDKSCNDCSVPESRKMSEKEAKRLASEPYWSLYRKLRISWSSDDEEDSEEEEEGTDDTEKEEPTDMDVSKDVSDEDVNIEVGSTTDGRKER